MAPRDFCERNWYVPDPGTAPDYEGSKWAETDKKSGAFEHQVRGAKPSKALLRRIAELTDQPAAAESEFVAARVLKLRAVRRHLGIQTLAMPPRAG
jgi:hypothetical protein